MDQPSSLRVSIIYSGDISVKWDKQIGDMGEGCWYIPKMSYIIYLYILYSHKTTKQKEIMPVMEKRISQAH